MQNARAAYLGVIEDETGASVDGRRSGVRCWVWLLTSMKLEGLELGLPVSNRRDRSSVPSIPVAYESSARVTQLVELADRHGEKE